MTSILKRTVERKTHPYCLQGLNLTDNQRIIPAIDALLKALSLYN